MREHAQLGFVAQGQREQPAVAGLSSTPIASRPACSALARSPAIQDIRDSHRRQLPSWRRFPSERFSSIACCPALTALPIAPIV